ncbi:Phospholipase carboxylesterase [Micractinium conductrix]|uniref:Phospholipase carboxylesterase n=1 Tax=Micractinium conductrix TaxID=554055 RepID=A0A2P6VCN4_9CHLO|nr:Phospholipase carboxylesterase [Micractinium conductrix]|eukprot:PSC71839.1 Phospholipase carboxylesterase [Micractinium conductrix]
MLHGLGDSGAGWEFLARELSAELPHTAFVFPHAPQRPISRFDGQRSAAWFDISAIPGQADRQGLMDSLRYVEGLLEEQAAQGVPLQRIVVGGFSQGGAVALLALRSRLRVAGVLALSAFVPLPDDAPLVSDANAATPILMCHGDADSMITLERAQRSVEGLRRSAALLDFRVYDGLAHNVNSEEMEDVRQFLRSRLAQE